MSNLFTKLGVASLVITGSTVMMASAMADNYNYQSNYQGEPRGNAYGHQSYTTTTATTTATTTTPTATPTANPYNYHHQNASPSNNGNRYAQYNNGNHYGQYNQPHYANQNQVINGRPQYNYHNNYQTRTAYPTYNRSVDYRNYGYTSRPQWYGRMHRNEYNLVRRDGRDYYYLQPAIYNTGVIIGRPQPGVVLMQYPDRTLEVIEATRLILDVLAR